MICLGSDKNVIQTIYYGNKSGAGISHSGDNTTGAGSGDDEKIRIDFNSVPANVVECFVTVNIFSDGYSFSAVHDAYVRLCTLGGRSFYSPGHELARYKLDAGNRQPYQLHSHAALQLHGRGIALTLDP